MVAMAADKQDKSFHISTEQQRERSDRAVLAHRDDLRRLLQRFDPQEYACFVARILSHIEYKPSRIATWPPHFMLHSIEANCVYYQKQYNRKSVTPSGVLAVRNAYVGFEDPYLHYSLEQSDWRSALRAMAHQQFYTQELANCPEFGRTILLFLDNDPLPKTSLEFHDKYGLSIHDWVYMCYAVYAGALEKMQRREPPVLRKENFFGSDLTTMPTSAVDPFFRLSSASPEDIGREFTRVREEIRPFLEICIRSGFLKCPMIAFEDGDYLLPYAPFVTRHAWEGAYHLCREISTFSDEFGKSFTRYVGGVTNEIPDRLDTLTDKELDKNSDWSGRACDYLVDLPDCVLLIECKAVTYAARLVTQNAVAGDNSTAKIVESFDQILQSARNIRRGALSSIFSNPTKPILGITVVFGDIPLVDEPQFQEEIVKVKMSEKGYNIESWPNPLEFPPQVLPIRTFEDLVVTLKHRNQSVLSLVREKLMQPYALVGDWPAFLQSLSRDIEGLDSAKLKVTDEATDRFVNEMVGGEARQGPEKKTTP